MHLAIALEKADFLPASRVTDDTSILTLKTLVLEPLLRWHDGRVGPGLFARWSASPDGRDWQFELREGATFHDGTPCTTEHVLDFLRTIVTARDTFGMPWSYARYFAHTVFSAPSPTQLRARSPHPFGDIVDLFSEFFLSLPDGDGNATIGTGPWRVTDFVRGQRVALARVGCGEPRTLALLAMPEATARHEAVTTGACDAALNLERMTHVPFAEGLDWQRKANTLSVMYYLNCASGLFASAEARRAVNHAVDAQAIVDALFQGLGMPASTIVSPFHLGHRAPIAPIAYDLDAARALLDRAGGGRDIVLRTPRHMPERADAISAMVADGLARVGLSATIDVQDDRPAYAREIGAKRMGDMAIFDSSPHSTFRILDDKISSATKAVWWQGFDDDETQRRVARANAALGDDAREHAYARCLRRLNANPPWLYLFHPVEVIATRKGLAGLALDHKGVLNIR